MSRAETPPTPLVRVETRLDRLSECIQELARAIAAKGGV